MLQLLEINFKIFLHNLAQIRKMLILTAVIYYFCITDFYIFIL